MSSLTFFSPRYHNSPLIVNLNLEYQWHSRDNNQLKHSKQRLINHKVFMGSKYRPYYSFVVESNIFFLLEICDTVEVICNLTEFHRSDGGHPLDEHSTIGIEQASLKTFCIQSSISDWNLLSTFR